MKVSLFLLVFAFWSNTVDAAGDPIIGKSKAIICIGCHASDGNSDNPDYPKLAGQVASYLSKQLNDFKSGARVEEHMSSMVEAITVADIPHVAAYFSSQKRKQSVTSKKINNAGKDIFYNGIAFKNITACSNCHGLNGLGVLAEKFPSIAGQHAQYITKILKDFRNGTRHNDPQKMMRNIAIKLSDVEINNLSIFISNLN